MEVAFMKTAFSLRPPKPFFSSQPQKKPDAARPDKLLLCLNGWLIASILHSKAGKKRKESSLTSPRKEGEEEEEETLN